MVGWFLINNNKNKCPERFAPSKAQMNTIEYRVRSLEFSVECIKTEISLLRKAIDLSNKRINNVHIVPSYDNANFSREILLSFNENGINCQGNIETANEITSKVLLLENKVESLKPDILSLMHEADLLKNNPNIRRVYSEFIVNVEQNETIDDFKNIEMNDKNNDKVKKLEHNVKTLKNYISSLRKETVLLKECIDKVKSDWAIDQAYNISGICQNYDKYYTN